MGRAVAPGRFERVADLAVFCEREAFLGDRPRYERILNCLRKDVAVHANQIP